MTLSGILNMISGCMDLMPWVLWAFMLAFVCSFPVILRFIIGGGK